MLRGLTGLLLALGLTVNTSTTRPVVESFKIDPATSRVTIVVGKAGLFSVFAGHTHEVAGPIESGTVDFDRSDLSRSRVLLVIAAAGLTVTGRGEPRGDVPKVQQTMESEKVLDVKRYPRLLFQSNTVTVKARDESGLDLVIGGQLTIRDVARPLAVTVRAELKGDAMIVTGHFTINQTAYGITPITVGGVIAVKDALDVNVSITARNAG